MSNASPVAKNDALPPQPLDESEVSFREQHKEWWAILSRNAEPLSSGDYSLHRLHST
jgi:hypothetical protein